MTYYVTQESRRCATCVHFRRHYVRRSDGVYVPLEYGHCVFPRLEKREPGQTCRHWVLGRNFVASRPYLWYNTRRQHTERGLKPMKLGIVIRPLNFINL